MHAADAHTLPPPTRASVSSSFRVHAYSVPARLVASALLVLSAANLLQLAVLLVLDLARGDLPPPPLLLALRLLLLSLLPGGLALLLRAWVSAEVEVQPTQLVVRSRHAWFELPFDVLAGVRPWRVPLPGPGLSLRLTSGRSFRYGLQCADPTPLLAALGRAFPPVATAVDHPSTRFARARSAALRRRGLQLGVKFGLFPLLPTALYFRVHQYIAYGGLLGEYHLLGLGAWLRTLALTWLNVTAHLVLYAAVLRALVEVVSFGAAWLLPSRAEGVRKVAELTSRLAYYVGIPALVAALFLR